MTMNEGEPPRPKMKAISLQFFRDAKPVSQQLIDGGVNPLRLTPEVRKQMDDTMTHINGLRETCFFDNEEWGKMISRMAKDIATFLNAKVMVVPPADEHN
jgi:hypothetical protein